MSLYLARADRVVVGADLTRASLRLGAAAARRFGVDSVRFVETDLRRPGCGPAPSTSSTARACCTTRPTRARPSRAIARLVRPGGIIVLGLYNALRAHPAAPAPRSSRG